MRIQLDGQEIHFGEAVIQDLIDKNPSLVKEAYLRSLGHDLEGKGHQFVDGLWASLVNEQASIAHAKNRRVKEIEANSA